MAQFWGQVESWGQGAPAPLLKPLVGRGGPWARAGLMPSCGHSGHCLQLWAGRCLCTRPLLRRSSAPSRGCVPVHPLQTWGSLGLGQWAPGPGCLQLGRCSVCTTLLSSHVSPGRRPCFPGEPRERCRWTWQACPLEGEFSFLAEGVGRARTPWGDEGPWGLSCGAGISRATEHADHTPHRPATPSRSEEGSLTELGGPHPAPPAAGQLPGQPPAPGPRQAALSCLRLGGPLSGPLACGWDWAATLTPGLS